MTQSPPSVLVTGAAGFIGSRFVEACLKKGIPTLNIISVDQASHFKTRTEHQRIAYGPIVDRDQLFDWLKKNNPPLRCVIHMGACSKTTELDENFLKKVNVEYSQSIWRYCTEKRIPLIYASSAATYGAGEMGYNDDETLIPQLKPLNPYGKSKWLFDLWALEEEKKGSAPPSWCGLKFFNVYGFGERHKEGQASVVLHAFDQIQKTGKVKLFRSHRAGIQDGHQKRDFISIDDVVNVMDFAMTHPIRRGIYNLGTDRARTFLDLVRAVFAALKKPEQIEWIDTPEVLRERYQYFTEAKMDHLRTQGYTPAFTSLETGIQTYVEHLKKELKPGRNSPVEIA